MNIVKECIICFGTTVTVTAGKITSAKDSFTFKFNLNIIHFQYGFNSNAVFRYNFIISKSKTYNL
jgi:hypothetical protein